MVPNLCLLSPEEFPTHSKKKWRRKMEKLERHGVITKTETSDWTSPVVVVPKSDKSVRICGDYKDTITAKDLFAAFSGFQGFQ